MSQKPSSTYLIVGLIIGLIIGAAIGWAVTPKGVPEEEYNAVVSERDALRSELDAIRPEYEALKALVGTLPTDGVITMSAWSAGSPVDYYRAENLKRAAKLLETLLRGVGLNITIEMDSYYEHVSDWGAWKSKFASAFEAGEAPDIISGIDMVEAAEAGWIVSVDEYYAKYKDLLADIPEYLWDAVKYKGKMWGVPQDVASQVFYFRKDVLRQLGWSEEEIEALPDKIAKGEVTWYDLAEVGKEAVAKGLVQWGFFHRPNWGTSLEIPYYLAGGDFYDVETGKLVLDKSALKDMFTLFYTLAQVDKVLPDTMIGTSWREIHMGFVNGRVLFWLGGSWHWGEWQKVEYHETLGALPESYLWENVGFALYPALEKGGKAGVTTGPWKYYICSQSKYPELAFLICYLATIPPYDTDHALTSSHLPVRYSTLNYPPFVEKGGFLYKVSTFVAKHGMSKPILHPKWGILKDMLLEHLVKVEKGTLTPDEAVESLVNAAQAELGEELIVRE
ncbi:MAG: sugar ABC transporter substrate-binding protein [Candidatus Bathyarchaeota archaeon B24]|nr:MAG: sugar ABC transporter substrate-binding protein [Candidatus Bathyarchaeota archaeon B24]